MGKWAQIGLKFLLEWDTDSAKDYYFANCYKVIAQDSQDTIIRENASLKNKVK